MRSQRSHFNPRAPCGARQNGRRRFLSIVRFQPTRPLRGATDITTSKQKSRRISTHAPLAGRDCGIRNRIRQRINFNPRAPCGARPNRVFNPCNSSNISTHAPLAGRDVSSDLYLTTFLNFNPRAPCGARQNQKRRQKDFIKFQPTRPLRGATLARGAVIPPNKISTHAPLAGRDSRRRSRRRLPAHFNPRAPCGARRSGLECTSYQA